jgi:hypothetical protein
MANNEKITGMSGTYNDIGEKSGFITDGYLDKKGTPQGEGAMFNRMPPGQEIENQVVAEINAMPYRKVVEESYPEDGWSPKPKIVV